MIRPGRLAVVMLLATVAGTAGCAVPTVPAPAGADPATHTEKENGGP